MRALIDICVIVDVLQDRKPFSDDAQKVLLLLAKGDFEGFLTAKSLTDIYYLSHRITHSKENSKEILKKLFSVFAVLDTTAEDVFHATILESDDFEDAVMIQTALRNRMDCIVTRNKKDYSKATLPVCSPKEFFMFLEEKNL